MKNSAHSELYYDFLTLFLFFIDNFVNTATTKKVVQTAKKRHLGDI